MCKIGGSEKIGKKKIAVLIIVILLLLIGGVFLWQENKKEIKGSPEDYVIMETEEGKFVINEKAGLTVKVPEGWITEKIEVMHGSITFYPSDTESIRPNKKAVPPLKKGCMIEIAVGYEKTTLDEIRKEVEEAHESLIMKSDEFEIVKIDGESALKNNFDCVDIGPSVGIYLSKENKLYSIGMTASREDVERCSEGLDKFLETVSIQ